tara:strand:- start:1368 stop:2378 length:1011 start_codon:yes stop_codon:yes gene_type:complete
MIQQKKISPNPLQKLLNNIQLRGLKNTIHKIIKKIKIRIHSPGNLIKPTIKQRNKYIAIRKKILFKRGNISARKMEMANGFSNGKIDPMKGFMLKTDHEGRYDELRESLIDQFKLEDFDVKDYDKKEISDISGKGTPIIPVTNDHINQNDLLLNFLTDKKIIGTIAEYLGAMPWLYSADIWVSHTQEEASNSSQNFHMDWEDQRIIKLFFYLDDITDDHAPFCLLSSSDSKKVLEFYKSKYESNIVSQRLSDEEVYEVVNKTDLIKLTGPKNSIGLVDTCNVLHFGSRPSKYPRKLMACMYASPFSIQNYIFQKTRFSSGVITDGIKDPWSWVIKH